MRRSRALEGVGVEDERLADDVADRHPRVERGVRVLQHDLDVAPQPAQLAWLEARHLAAEQLDRALGRGLQAHQQPAEGRLAAAGLAHDAEGLALVELERDAVDGLDVADGALEDDPLGEREVLLDVADLEDDLARVGARRRRLLDRGGVGAHLPMTSSQ